MLGVGVYATWSYAERADLLREDAHAEVSRAIRRRIVVAQSLYAAGALVGMISVPLGTVLIILIQLNYAIAPRLPVLSRL